MNIILFIFLKICFNLSSAESKRQVCECNNAIDFDKVSARDQSRRNILKTVGAILKVDLEDYNETTEAVNIDNFDYNTEDRDLIQKRTDDDDLSLFYGENKIIGGTNANINSYPYQVGYVKNCGGAIIDKRWVITAAHCRYLFSTKRDQLNFQKNFKLKLQLIGLPLSDFKLVMQRIVINQIKNTKSIVDINVRRQPYVKMGSEYLDMAKYVPVIKVFLHPLWSAGDKVHPFDYDYQLLLLGQNLKFSDSIQPINVARNEDMIVGTIVTVTGWGKTQEYGSYSNTLQAIKVPIIAMEVCQKVDYQYFRGTLTPRMFCAGYPDGRMDACQGDSGGPAVANGRLFGMVSFGYGCATPQSYGVYSKVAAARTWIESVTQLKLN